MSKQRAIEILEEVLKEIKETTIESLFKVPDREKERNEKTKSSS